MTDHNERLVASPAVGLDNILHQSAVPVIKAMKRLIKNQEIRILHESARAQAAPGVAHHSTPQGTNVQQGVRGPTSSSRIGTSRSRSHGDAHKAPRCQQCHWPRFSGTPYPDDRPYASQARHSRYAFYIPNAFPATSQFYVAGIALRIVGAYQTQERRLAGSVFPRPRPNNLHYGRSGKDSST